MVVSNDQKFLYTIGNSNELNYKEIYKLNCGSSMDPDDCWWELKTTQLKYGRYEHVAFSIPDTLAEKLCN